MDEDDICKIGLKSKDCNVLLHIKSEENVDVSDPALLCDAILESPLNSTSTGTSSPSERCSTDEDGEWKLEKLAMHLHEQDYSDHQAKNVWEAGPSDFLMCQGIKRERAYSSSEESLDENYPGPRAEYGNKSSRTVIDKEQMNAAKGLCSKKLAAELRNSGKSYTDTNGKQVGAKQMTDEGCSNCRLNCSSYFTYDQRKKIFDDFWKLANFDVQNVLLCGLVDIAERARSRAVLNTCRNYSRKYFLHNEKLDRRQVCKSFFINTLAVSNGRLDRLLRKSVADDETISDRRGKTSSANKKSDECINDVKKHICSFPTSAICDSDQNDAAVRYLPRNLNIAKMHELFETQQKQLGKEVVSYELYRLVLKRDFNLAFPPSRRASRRTLDS